MIDTVFCFYLFLCISTVLAYFLIKNILKRKKLEELLDNQRKFDSILLDTIPHPIFYKDTEGKYLGCNLAFSNLLKISKEKIEGKMAKDFFSEDVAKANSIIDYNLLNNASTKTFKKISYDAGDELQQFTITKAVFLNINGKVGGVVGVMDDITQKAQREQFIIQQNKLAEMGDMIAAIAHQWNEPLVELSAIVQDLAYSHKNNSIKQDGMDSYVRDVMNQIQYMSETIRDFRNFLKPSTNKTVFDVRKSFDKLFALIKRQINYFYIGLEVNYNPEFATMCIYGYENEFMQVLLNIINNAKSKIIEKQKNNTNMKGFIKIDVWQEYDSTFINIIDNAGGVSMDTISNMFNPYFSTKKDGTGLGLYMAKIIIENKMKGKIGVVSDKDSVTFNIEVPSKSTKIDLE